jgi:hypothetical protein
MTQEELSLTAQGQKAEHPENLNQEVLDRFGSMLDHVDFEAQLDTLNIGRLQFSRKRDALKELRAMYVGLWKLALNRSFPNDSIEIFEKFLDSSEIKSKSKRRKADAFSELCHEYAKTLEVEGDTNFINVAILICQHLGRTEQEDLRRISLQLALDMRSMYHNIFERLI